MKNIWTEIESIIKQSNKKMQIFEGDYKTGEKECNRLHIPLDSVLSSIVLHSNGIIVDNWIRIYGQDSSLNNGVFFYNREKDYLNRMPGMFIVASDVLGGLFAININKFSEKRNKIWYFAPDTLEWECIDMMYNEFVAWSFQGNIDEFYSTMRWENWKDDVKNITLNSAILIYPFLWASECDLETASKSVVSLDEIIELNFEYVDNLTEGYEE